MAKGMPRAGRTARTPGAVQPPRQRGVLPSGTKRETAARVYPAGPQPSASKPTPQGGPGS
jgi:hypothetical protein